MTHVADLFRPEWEFVLRAMIAGLALAGICAVLGVYVVLRRIVFVGAALAELSSLGVAISFLPAVMERLPHPWTPGLFAMLGGLLGVGMLAPLGTRRRIPREALIGVFYGSAAALAILVLLGGGADHADLEKLIQGDILVVDPVATALAIGVALVAAIVHLLFGKEFLLVSLDLELARATGLRADLWEWLFYLTLGIVIAIGIKVVGTLLVFGYLVLPPVTALLLVRRLRQAIVVAIVVALVATVVGVYASAWHNTNLPMGPSIVGVCVAILIVAAAIAFVRERWRSRRGRRSGVGTRESRRSGTV